MARQHYTSKQFCTYLDANKAWDIIEYKTMGYDRDIDELYPEHFLIEKQADKNKKLLDSILLSGEQYAELEGKCVGYVLTSNGRVINLKSGNQTSIYFKQNTITISVRDIRMDLATEFMKYGWPFDKNEIKRLYDKYKWKYLWGLNRINYKK